MTKKTKTNNYTWEFDALIGVHQSWFSYFDTYKRAVDELFNSILDNRSVDMLSYPFLFLIRHTLELGLKANIYLLAKYSEKDYGVGKTVHTLKSLQDAMVRHFEDLSETEGKDNDVYKGFYAENRKLTKLIEYFESIDRLSMTFRYPVDKKGNKNMDHQERVNLIEIKDKFDEAITILAHTQDVLSPFFDMIDEYRDTYENDMY